MSCPLQKNSNNIGCGSGTASVAICRLNRHHNSRVSKIFACMVLCVHPLAIHVTWLASTHHVTAWHTMVHSLCCTAIWLETHGQDTHKFLHSLKQQAIQHIHPIVMDITTSPAALILGTYQVGHCYHSRQEGLKECHIGASRNLGCSTYGIAVTDCGALKGVQTNEPSHNPPKIPAWSLVSVDDLLLGHGRCSCPCNAVKL